jgi:hypothetical protein
VTVTLSIAFRSSRTQKGELRDRVVREIDALLVNRIAARSPFLIDACQPMKNVIRLCIEEVVGAIDRGGERRRRNSLTASFAFSARLAANFERP